MPRKASKTDKPALLFAERPVCGARAQHEPEVRAALNPKDFFTDTQSHSNATLNAWVTPQFDPSLLVAPLGRLGRKKCQSTTSILDRSSLLSRKTSVCKFPSLSFQTASRNRSLPPKSTRTKKATESAVSGADNHPQGSRQTKKTVSRAQCVDTPKRQSASIRKRNEQRGSDGAASSSRRVDPPEAPSNPGESCRIESDGASTPAPSGFRNSDLSGISPAPDVDTPKLIQEETQPPSSPSALLLLAQPRTPPCNPPPDILVADTPERDYGVKVTWRRRRDMMLMAKKQGYLSDSEVLIHS